MKYLSTDMATNWDAQKSVLDKVIELLLFFVPKANPGYEGKMHLVNEWLIEFDDENIPFREVALDIEGNPVFSGPNHKNHGYWLDTNMKFSNFTGVEIKKSEFEKLWLKSGVEAIT